MISVVGMSIEPKKTLFHCLFFRVKIQDSWQCSRQVNLCKPVLNLLKLCITGPHGCFEHIQLLSARSFYPCIYDEFQYLRLFHVVVQTAGAAPGRAAEFHSGLFVPFQSPAAQPWQSPCHPTFRQVLIHQKSSSEPLPVQRINFNPKLAFQGAGLGGGPGVRGEKLICGCPINVIWWVSNKRVWVSNKRPINALSRTQETGLSLPGLKRQPVIHNPMVLLLLPVSGIF